MLSWVWWFTTVNLALEKLRQKGHEFKQGQALRGFTPEQKGSALTGEGPGYS